jgi:hypothetical protein
MALSVSADAVMLAGSTTSRRLQRQLRGDASGPAEAAHEKRTKIPTTFLSL